MSIETIIIESGAELTIAEIAAWADVDAADCNAVNELRAEVLALVRAGKVRTNGHIYWAAC